MSQSAHLTDVVLEARGVFASLTLVADLVEQADEVGVAGQLVAADEVVGSTAPGSPIAPGTAATSRRRPALRRLLLEPHTTNSKPLQKVLEYLGLPTSPPPNAPARLPVDLDLPFDDAQHDESRIDQIPVARPTQRGRPPPSPS